MLHNDSNSALRQVPAPERLPPAHSAGGKERAGLSSPAAELAEGLADVALFQPPEALQRLQGRAMRAHNIHVAVRKSPAHSPGQGVAADACNLGAQAGRHAPCMAAVCRRLRECRRAAVHRAEAHARPTPPDPPAQTPAQLPPAPPPWQSGARPGGAPQTGATPGRAGSRAPVVSQG